MSHTQSHSSDQFLIDNTKYSESIPRLLFIEDLARITGLSVTSIRCYTGNAEKFGHLIPKWFKFPGARRLVWLEDDVRTFITNARGAAQVKVRRRGRPTKSEQIEINRLKGQV